MRRILAVMAVVLGVALSVMLPAAPALAFASGTLHLADDYGGGPSLMPGGGSICSGCNVWTGGNWQVQFTKIGSVCTVAQCGTDWPFDTGSGYNSKYLGHAVWSIAWNANNGYCISAPNGTPNVTLESKNCDHSNVNQAWVESGGWLIDAGSTNTAYENNYSEPRQVMVTDTGGGSCTDTGQVWAKSPNNGGTCWNNWAQF